MAVTIQLDSPAGEFLISQGVPAHALNSTRFLALSLPGGDALTVIRPFGRAMVFIKSQFLKPDLDGDLLADRSLPLLRHELFHVQQGHKWGFISYWARHLWARVRHLNLSPKKSSVEAPAYELLNAAHAALDALGIPG
jgi:hypothetical protein